jgi:undecaprenyl-diphosphatase
MTIFQAGLLGLIEGITEFLPISSTFHLIFASRALGVVQTDFTKFFEVFIQAGAILPLVYMTLKEFWRNRRLFWLTVVGFLPAAVVGLVLHKVIKGVFFESPWLMVSVFVIVGIGFLLVEQLIAQGKLRLHKKLTQLSWFEAIKIGLFQALAVIPGVSRSGSLMAGGMLLGFTREEATKFSFYLAVPTILAAAVLDGWQSREVLLQLGQSEWWQLAVGFGVAMVSAALAISWLLKYVRTHSLAGFGWYRLALGAVLVSWLLMT